MAYDAFTSPPSPSPQPRPQPGGGGRRMLGQQPPALPQEKDTPIERRRLLAALTAGLAGLEFTSAVTAVTAEGFALPMPGLARLARVAVDHGLGFAAWVEAFEGVTAGFGLLWFAALLAFGASSRPKALAGEILVYHRRQCSEVFMPALGLGLGLLLFGQVLGLTSHPILAGLVEMPGMGMAGLALWRLLLPEARIAVSVIVDRNQGYGSRVVLTGGRFNKAMLIIRHDQLVEPVLIATDLNRVLQFRSLILGYAGPDGAHHAVLIPGAGNSHDLPELVHYLVAGFSRALRKSVLNYPATMQRGLEQIY